MNFGQVDKIALFGGSQLMGALLAKLAASATGRQLHLFVAPRHFAELGEQVLKLGIPHTLTEDIDVEPALASFVTPRTIGLALGAAWPFGKPTVARFGGKLVDFMGIDLPRYRGGAHYTWQILHDDRRGSCHLQLIEGGEATFHLGPVIKSSSYAFPESARVPQDYFDAAIPRELAFIEDFIREIDAGHAFTARPLDESRASCFPFLNTLRHGIIDWSWSAAEVERFIRAFDEPYAGASTTWIDRGRAMTVHLKGARLDASEGPFHPFTAGIVLRRHGGKLWIAARDGAVVIERAQGADGASLLDAIQMGDRLRSAPAALAGAIGFDAVYTAEGLKA